MATQALRRASASIIANKQHDPAAIHYQRVPDVLDSPLGKTHPNTCRGLVSTREPLSDNPIYAPCARAAEEVTIIGPIRWFAKGDLRPDAVAFATRWRPLGAVPASHAGDDVTQLLAQLWIALDIEADSRCWRRRTAGESLR